MSSAKFMIKMSPCLNQPMTRERDNFKKGERENELAVRLKQPKKGTRLSTDLEPETELVEQRSNCRDKSQGKRFYKLQGKGWNLSVLNKEKTGYGR